MKHLGLNRFYILILLFVFFISPLVADTQPKEFVVVIDPGHGGKDPGAVGRFSKEKDIVLSVSKMLGDMITSNMKDVKVIYTRKTDVFIPLEQRASIANGNSANLFISIHVNAAKNKAAFGAETFTLGLAKSQANLDVAMAENSVILLEDDYETKYSGFDPNSIESYIMFEFMMDSYLDNSLNFATLVQQQFVDRAKRHDRGVRQAGFWVLHRSACPSVLVELGFISNNAEEQYLNSAVGQRQLVESIYTAFVNYKSNHDDKLGYVKHDNANESGNTAVKQPKVEEKTEIQSHNNSEPSIEKTESEIATATSKPIYKLQIIASKTQLSHAHETFKGVQGLEWYQEGGFYKYTIGNDTDYNKINQLRLSLKSKFPDAFIIAFYNDVKIPVSQARKLSN